MGKVEKKVSQEFLAVAAEPFCVHNALVHTIELETWLLKGMRSHASSNTGGGILDNPQFLTNVSNFS